MERSGRNTKDFERLEMTDGIYSSKLLSTFSQIQHGVTKRILGDIRKNQNDSYVGVGQVHGSEVVFADAETSFSAPDADGLVTKTPGMRIGVRTADCVPVLMADVEARAVSAIHAGWKGITKGVVPNAVRAMRDAGAHIDSLMVYIGPHIGACCYTVDEKRASFFHRRYIENGTWHIDIGAEVLRDLMDAGIPREHIDAPITCTSCQNNIFFSFRKDTKETFGEMLSFIALV